MVSMNTRVSRYPEVKRVTRHFIVSHWFTVYYHHRKYLHQSTYAVLYKVMQILSVVIVHLEYKEEHQEQSVHGGNK